MQTAIMLPERAAAAMNAAELIRTGFVSDHSENRPE